MLRTRIALVAVLPLALIACGSDSKNENTFEAKDAIATVPPELIGTFANPTAPAGAFSVFVLKNDGTFHSGTQVTCIKAPCDPVPAEGLFKLYQRSGQTFMSLNDRSGALIDRYEYKYRGDVSTLTLKKIGSGGEWHAMPRASVAWCDALADCTHQNLPVGPCAGQFACEKNACNYVCTKPDPVEAKDTKDGKPGGS